MRNRNPVERAVGWVLGPPVRWVGRRVERRIERRVQLHVGLVEREVRAVLSELPEPPEWMVPVVVAISFVGAVVAGHFADPDRERTGRERAEPEPEATAERGTTSAPDDAEPETPVLDALEVLMGEREPPAERSEVKAAYRSLAVETHPDQGGEVAQFIEVREAWETLEEEGLSGDGLEDGSN